MSSTYGIPQRRLLPPEVSTVLNSWWLALGFGLFGLICVWPIILKGLSSRGGTQPEPGMIGWLVLLVIVAAGLGVGGWVARNFVRGRPSGLRMLKMLTFAGMILGVIIMALTVWLNMASQSTGGAAPKVEMGKDVLFSGMLLGLMALIPYVFAILAISLTGNFAVREFFSRPQEEPAPAPGRYDYQPPPVDTYAAAPEVEEEVMVSEPAQAADLEDILEGELEAQERSDEVEIVMEDDDPPSTKQPKGKKTQLRPKKKKK